ncbi:dihydroneopterin aldolase [Lentibacter algarum]|uniref:dihydroneopterin aldolase n=1 Tax=Lentibacter algarum TaxID=576131 RepID=UPI001C091106|nr:dihydroneopterin aldolase [Lentibacter algarum]MBU2983459.1 dihydroneopterin aldolase [Lentibacter algarum]
MMSEIRQAFEHPDERSRATSHDGPLDRISLRDHTVDVEIGAFQAERGTTQRICFNVVVEVRPLAGQVDDDVDRILSYDKVTEAIADALAEERLNLLETLAERIAERILWEPQAERVFVRIEKLDRGPGALGVEIVRALPDVVESAGTEERVHPQMVYLSNAAITSEFVTGWLDQLSAQEAPLLLCVGAPDVSAPNSAVGQAQRRIDLLSLEQNAWVLAGRDKRCVVVQTRTELDWAMKNNQISVWAPSKIVLDSVEGPTVEETDALALALWFATEMDAFGFLAIGAEVGADAVGFPVRSIDVETDRI